MGTARLLDRGLLESLCLPDARRHGNVYLDGVRLPCALFPDCVLWRRSRISYSQAVCRTWPTRVTRLSVLKSSLANVALVEDSPQDHDNEHLERLGVEDVLASPQMLDCLIYYVEDLSKVRADLLTLAQLIPLPVTVEYREHMHQGPITWNMLLEVATRTEVIALSLSRCVERFMRLDREWNNVSACSIWWRSRVSSRALVLYSDARPMVWFTREPDEDERMLLAIVRRAQ